jgi:hypothetical protein
MNNITREEKEHRHNARNHAQRRAKERLGIQLTKDDIFCISNLLGEGRGVHCFENRYLIRYGPRIYFVAYDEQLHTIKTFFPHNEAMGALISHVKPKDHKKLGLS